MLWLYRGTGDYKAPFAGRTRIGGGWNAYDRLLSVGDLDMDGTPDLLARTPGGDLLRYSGTGSAQAPFAKPVKIGHGFQSYNLL
ncbi:FG-GAP repeat domain-containing protein [Streptomyces sp. NPDC050842]|uniref:FG-GAP repeat domain-containing protein n=1 Tax=Streptomyces sp. NPDC050842 TaxID=3365636 RepID=UPI0037B34D2C